MEQMTPEQTREAPERKRKKQPETLHLKLPPFLSQIGRDVKWYYDVRLWLPMILILLVMASCTGNSAGTRSAQEKYEAIIQQMEAQAQEIQEQSPPETTPPTAAAIDPEAEALAVLADSVGAGRSDNVKTIIMWVAINRTENAIEGHGKSLEEEIAMPQQWQGYDPETAYSQRTYDIAVEVLATRDSDALRPLDRDMLWMVLNNDGSITVRNKFQGTNWHEKTVK